MTFRKILSPSRLLINNILLIISQECAMKKSRSAIVLFAFLFLAMLGCSDQLQSPVAPDEQAELQKAKITTCNFVHYPVAPPEGGEYKFAGNNFIMKDVKVTEQMMSSDPLMVGTLVHYLNEVVDAVTGEGNTHGKWTLTLSDDVGGGVWEGTYTGKRSYSPGVNEGFPDYEFITPLKLVAIGKGGAIDGMQFKGTTIIYSWGIIVEGWYGKGEGDYKSH
jgi:hypothetical protein